MKENYIICNCKQVSYFDIADALHTNKKFDDVLQAFEDVQKVTHCSTGCGGCHNKVLDVISEILMGPEKA
jgi:NAD(P)H-nitrite reductase large subunit